MNLKLKLPSRSTAAGRIPKRNLSGLLRKVRRYALYGAGLALVFVVFAWINLPTKALAWRISHEAKKQGIMLTVEDLSISPFGAVTLEDIVWSFKPSHPDQTPVPFVVEELEIDVSLLSLLIGNMDVDIEGTLDEGTIVGNYTKGSEEGKVELEIEDLPLYAVPKLQQAVNAPVRGLFGLSVDLTLPENKFEQAFGTMQLTCAGCSVGDGETKMYVPGARGMLSQGVTMPEFNLGSVVGQLNVDQGEAVMEDFEAKSDDITLRIGGKVLLDDPFQKSRLDLVVKLFVSEALQENNDQIRLLIGTSSKQAKMDPPDEGWLGFKLRGSVGRPRFSGINSKSKEDRFRDAREKRRDRAEERRKKKAERAAAKKKKEEERAAAAGDDKEGVFVPDPNDKDDEDGKGAEKQEPVSTAVTFETQAGAAAGGEPAAEDDEEDEEEDDEEAGNQSETGGEATEGGEEEGEPQIIQ